MTKQQIIRTIITTVIWWVILAIILYFWKWLLKQLIKALKKISQFIKNVFKLIFQKISKIPYRIVNVNKYNKIKELSIFYRSRCKKLEDENDKLSGKGMKYKNILIKIWKSMDTFADFYYYWQDIDSWKESSNFDSYTECLHQIKKTYPNIIMGDKVIEHDSVWFPIEFISCQIPIE